MTKANFGLNQSAQIVKDVNATLLPSGFLVVLNMSHPTLDGLSGAALKKQGGG